MSKKCNTMGMHGILQGHIPSKPGEVSFYTLPLVASSEKPHVRTMHTDKMENPFFLAAHKPIVAEVVGYGDM
jgi:hypothetical protein